MRLKLALLLLAGATSAFAQNAASSTGLDGPTIAPSRAVPVGKAPNMHFQLVKDSADEKVYLITFSKGDEVMSGLTDFAIAHDVRDAHFTAIGAASGATLAWLDLGHKYYHRIPVDEQCEVGSLMGDIATFNGKPVVHMHAIMVRHDGSTVGGHIFEMNINPTLEVFLTVDAKPLSKKPDDASGMKLIDLP